MRFRHVHRCIALLLTAALTGCTVSMEDLPIHRTENDGSGYYFETSLPENPKSLDPQYASDISSLTIIRNLYEGLVETDENGGIQMAAAEAVSVSDDGLIYTFTLHDDRKWFVDKNENDNADEGESWAVTADDYVYAFQRIYDPIMQSPYTSLFSSIENADQVLAGQMSPESLGVHAITPTQLQFTLSRPDALFLQNLTTTAALPCNRAFFASTKGRYGLDSQSVASCGAFYVRLWFYDPYGRDNLMYLGRTLVNDEVRKVSAVHLTAHIRKSDEAVAQDFKDKASDLLITPYYLKEYVEGSGYRVQSVRTATLGLVFNPENRIFANQNIRKGLSMGIDRAHIGTASGGDLTGAGGLVPPSVHSQGLCYREQHPDDFPLFDSTAADAAARCFKAGMEELEIHSIDSAKILVCPELMDSEQLHDIIQTWQELFGFYIGIENVDYDTYTERIESGDYTIAVTELRPGYDNPLAVLEAYIENSERFSYDSEQLRQEINSLRRNSSPAALEEQCARTEAQLVAAYHFIPIFYKNKYCIMRSENEGILYDPFSDTADFRNARHFE